jgi:predicted DNA-binding transcriptional regulator YafY
MSNYIIEDGVVDILTHISRGGVSPEAVREILRSVATKSIAEAQQPLLDALRELTGNLADHVASECDFHAIDASKWWKAVKRARKLDALAKVKEGK